MRLKKAEIWALAVTLLFLMLTVGYRLGRRARPADFSVSTAAASGTPAPAAVWEKRVNINTADAEELCTLAGVGPTLAERIIAWREAQGPFVRTEDITKVRGIGSSTYEQLRDQITVD